MKESFTALLFLFWKTAFMQGCLTSFQNLSKDWTHYECPHLGYASYASEQYKLGDSLTKCIKPNITIYFDTNNTTSMKYHFFEFILETNDTNAWDILQKTYKDTTHINVFCSCIFKSDLLSLELLDLYDEFISLKYLIGGTIYYKGKIFPFPKSDKKVYTQKCNPFKKPNSKAIKTETLVLNFTKHRIPWN